METRTTKRATVDVGRRTTAVMEIRPTDRVLGFPLAEGYIYKEGRSLGKFLHTSTAPNFCQGLFDYFLERSVKGQALRAVASNE